MMVSLGSLHHESSSGQTADDGLRSDFFREYNAWILVGGKSRSNSTRALTNGVTVFPSLFNDYFHFLGALSDKRH
jgi:hypothetical protein